MRRPISRDGDTLPAASLCLRSALPATLCFIHFRRSWQRALETKKFLRLFGKVMVYSPRGLAARFCGFRLSLKLLVPRRNGAMNLGEIAVDSPGDTEPRMYLSQ